MKTSWRKYFALKKNDIRVVLLKQIGDYLLGCTIVIKVRDSCQENVAVVLDIGDGNEDRTDKDLNIG